MEKRNRIPGYVGFMMMAVAIFIDIIQFILTLLVIGIILNPILITPFTWLTFYLWFKFRGVSFMNSSKRMSIMASCTLLEFIPILNAIPAWTLSVLILIGNTKVEDRAYNREMGDNYPETARGQQAA